MFGCFGSIDIPSTNMKFLNSFEAFLVYERFPGYHQQHPNSVYVFGRNFYLTLALFLKLRSNGPVTTDRTTGMSSTQENNNNKKNPLSICLIFWLITHKKISQIDNTSYVRISVIEVLF